ncbi:MAG: ATP-binding protein, partial [bacterium]
LKSPASGIYQFYTQKFIDPSFVFALKLSPKAIGEVVFGLGALFKDVNLHGGEAYILDGKSGQYLFATNPARYNQTFNSDQTPALTKVQKDLQAQTAGIAEDGNQTLVYTPFVNSYGVVEEIPQAAFHAASTAPAEQAGSPLDELQTPVTLAAVVVLAWVFLMFYVGLGLLLGPLKKARAKILDATQSGKSMDPETLRQFGKDEVGQIVQAVSELLRKLETEKTELERDKEEAVRQARTLIDNKNKESQQIQQQAEGVKKNLEDTTQQLADKLKELDALKGMAEGLRGQTEQSKADNAKLKTQISTLEASQAEAQKKITAADTKIKETEAKLLQALATASPLQVSQVRSAAIRTMAEELKTTLGIIKGYVSSALGATQGGINEKQQEFLGMVINRSARLEKFINDLLDIYQVEIEQEDAKTEEVNLPAEIEGLAFNFQAQAEVKNIKIKVEGKPNLPKVPIVRRRFNQLWNILYLQSIKDAPRGSTISISLEPLGDMVKVSLVDPGLVVKPENLPKLFDEFYDPKHPASPQLAGTGLKFALVKTILAAHGGGAVAEASNPGTLLILNFPMKRKVPGAVPAPVPVAAPSATPMGKAPIGTITPPAAKPVYTIPGIAKPMGSAPAAVAFSPGSTAFPKPGSAVPGIVPKPGIVPPAPAGKPSAAAGALDTLLAGNIPPATPFQTPASQAPDALDSLLSPKPTPSAANPPSMPAPGQAAPPSGIVPPKPVAPPMPGGPAVPTSGMPSIAPKAPGSPIPGAPPLGQGAPPPGVPPMMGKPVVPPMPGMPTVPGSSMPPAIPKPPSPGIGAPPPVIPLVGPKPVAPPVPGVSSVTPKPVVPPIPGQAPPIPGMPSAMGQAPPSVPGQPLRPAMPPPVPGQPPRPMTPGQMPPLTAPTVVPTSMKPSAPPGILDLDNLDGVIQDDASKPAAPKPGAVPPPLPPTMDKPIVKDLNKEGEGEIIE